MRVRPQGSINGVSLTPGRQGRLAGTSRLPSRGGQAGRRVSPIGAKAGRICLHGPAQGRTVNCVEASSLTGRAAVRRRLGLIAVVSGAVYCRRRTIRPQGCHHRAVIAAGRRP